MVSAVSVSPLLQNIIIVQSIAVAFEHSVLRDRVRQLGTFCGWSFTEMTRPGIHKSLEDMQALSISVIFAELSFHDNPCNAQCSNATAIDCTIPRQSRRIRYGRYGLGRTTF